ncbi:MAG TPA: hypothetical protein VGO08_20400 [Burkholderiales bacterium]|nr:hypothetical protein [Burkholderiales bacterium]
MAQRRSRQGTTDVYPSRPVRVVVGLAPGGSPPVSSGRYFQSIEIPEGGDLTNAVIDLVGEDVLMYASDYPHGESHFQSQ